MAAKKKTMAKKKTTAKRGTKSGQFTIPKTLGECADLLYTTKKKRLEAQKEVDAIEAFEKELKSHIIDTLPVSNASGVSGKIGHVKIVIDELPQISDHDKLRKFINRSKRYDLLYAQRVAAGAAREMWEDGKEIPGVEKYKNKKVSITKV